VGGEQEYGRKPEPEVVFAAILAKKRIFGFFWRFLVPVAMGLGGPYLSQKVLLRSQTFGENFKVLA